MERYNISLLSEKTQEGVSKIKARLVFDVLKIWRETLSEKILQHLAEKTSG